MPQSCHPLPVRLIVHHPCLLSSLTASTHQVVLIILSPNFILVLPVPDPLSSKSVSRVGDIRLRGQAPYVSGGIKIFLYKQQLIIEQNVNKVGLVKKRKTVAKTQENKIKSEDLFTFHCLQYSKTFAFFLNIMSISQNIFEVDSLFLITTDNVKRDQKEFYFDKDYM